MASNSLINIQIMISKYVFIGILPLFFIFLLNGCCVKSKCVDEKIMVIPYFDGKYQLPAVPVKGFYIRVDGRELHYINEIFPSPIDCNSDLPNIQLTCCKKYTFDLYVRFESIPDKKLNSANIKIDNRGNCFIPDVDPANN